MHRIAHPRVRTRLLLAGMICVLASMIAAPAAAQEPVHITGVTPVAAVTVPNGTSLEDALAQMPSTTTITVSEGDPIPVELDWELRELVQTSRGDNVVRQVWYPTARGVYEMLGTFELPDGVVQADPPVPLETVGIVVLAGGPLFELDDPELFDQPGTYTRESMTFPTPTGTVERTFTYYVPSTHDGTEAMPLVVTLHGAGSYGIGQLAYSDFDRVAEEEGFIVVAPDYGASALGTFTTPGIADFTSAIIDRLSEDFAIDERRVYASGISMGGGASVTLAYGLSDRIAAVAPVASGISRALAEDLPRPTTFVTFYGTQDSGWSPIFFAANERIAELNGASATPEVTTWPATPDDPTTINRYAHTGGVYGTEAVFYQVEEGGHTWPGKYQYASLISVGLTSQQFDATEVIWDHLSRQSLPIEVPVDILPDRINPGGRGLTPVAVLSTDEVDATTLELDVVRLGPGEARPRASSTQDVDGDGRLDIVLRFATQDLGIEPGDTSAALTGRATDGGAVDGSDTFVTAPG